MQFIPRRHDRHHSCVNSYPAEATRDKIGLFCCGVSGCDRSYSNKGSLTRHLKLDHGHVAPESESARFVCEVCDKRHKHAKELVIHYETHGVNIGMHEYSYNIIRPLFNDFLFFIRKFQI